MNASRRLWVGLGVLLLLSFAVLLWVGGEIHRVMPPVPSAVVTENGICIQLVALTRVVAELVPDSLAVQAIAALGWLVAFVPWVLRSSWIYLTPRVDGANG